LHGAVVSTTGFTVAVGVGEFEVVGSGVTCAVGFAIATPLFQINFLPDLTQVNFVVEVDENAPDLVQALPALTAALEIGVKRTAARAIERTIERFRTGGDYLLCVIRKVIT
jgi:hypothetical protein